MLYESLFMMTSLFQISYLIGIVHGCSHQLIAITEVEYKEIFNSTTHYVSVNVEDGIHCIHSCQTGNIHVCVCGGGGGGWVHVELKGFCTLKCMNFILFNIKISL